MRIIMINMDSYTFLAETRSHGYGDHYENRVLCTIPLEELKWRCLIASLRVLPQLPSNTERAVRLYLEGTESISEIAKTCRVKKYTAYQYIRHFFCAVRKDIVSQLPKGPQCAYPPAVNYMTARPW